MGEEEEFELNAGAFWRRCAVFRDAWMASRSGSEDGTDAVAICCGKQNGTATLEGTLSELVVKFLFDGLLITNTMVVLSEKQVVLVSALKKTKMFKQLIKNAPKDNKFPLELVSLSKKPTEEEMDQGVAFIKSSFRGQRVATLTKESPNGPVAELWAQQLAAAGCKTEDCAGLLESVLMVNDPKAVPGLVAKAAEVSIRAMKKVFVKSMEKVFEDDKKMLHSELAKRLEVSLADPAKKMKMPDFDNDRVASPQPIQPSVQSGGHYDLSLGSKSDDRELSADVLICQLGVDCYDFCCAIGRTFFVDPTKEMEETYEVLQKAHLLLIKSLVPGAVLGQVYDKVASFVADKNASLRKLLPGSLGHGTGMVVRYPHFQIESGNTAVVKRGMSFIVSTSFAGVELSEAGRKKKASLRDGKFSCIITDLVIVAESEPKSPTQEVDSSLDEIRYAIEDDKEDEEDDDDDDDDEEEEDGDEDDAKLAKKLAASAGSGERVTRSRTKTPEQLAKEKEVAGKELKIKENQKKLMLDKARRALRAEAGGGGAVDDGKGDNENGEKHELVNVYQKGPKEYPADLVRNQIYCDKEREAVLCPIGGFHVPFHISTIKSVTKVDEDNATILRIVFYYPTGNATFARDVPSSTRTLLTRFPELNYIKELTFKSRDVRNLGSQFLTIKNMQKRIKDKERQMEREADLMEQVDLVLQPNSVNRVRPIDCSMRPTLGRGKTSGKLYAHKNGLRYQTSDKQQQFDLIYANIKFFFFQECRKELTVLIHFTLKHPVMVGKTKTSDVQFYIEVVEASAALDNKRRNQDDADEIREEQREKEYRKHYNKTYKKFCQELVGLCKENDQPLGIDDDYDMPVRRLGFQGVPLKEMVWIYPSLHCLINLSEWPAFVVPLDDIEHIHFERVGLTANKNFDMVIILKSHMAPGSSTPQSITQIPNESLPIITEWLDSLNKITFTTGKMPLNWKANGVRASVYEEIEDGIFWKDKDLDGNKKDVGWNFLALEGDDEGGSDEEEQSSAYESDSGSGSEEESSSDDDQDDPTSDESGDDDDDDDDEDDGEDWDDLERKAKESDKKGKMRRREAGEDEDDDDEDDDDDDEDEKPRKKKSRR